MAIGWSGRVLGSDELAGSEIEVGQFLRHSEACRDCGGPDGCEHSGLVPVLDVSGCRLRYSFGGHCDPMAAQMQRQRAGRILSGSRIPSGYRKMTLANFERIELVSGAYRAAKIVATSLVDGEPTKGLYLCGEPGLGKTHLAIGILNEMVRKHVKGCIYITCADYLQALRDEMGDAVARKNLEELVFHAPVLVLDDFGAESVKDWVAEQLFRLVDHRYKYRDELVTIFTSNYTPDKIIARIATRTNATEDGTRIVSRIAEMSHIIRLQGEDYRMRRTGK